MKTSNRIPWVLLAALCLSWLSSASRALAQESEKAPFPKMDEILQGGGAGPEDPEARMRRLFGEVETKLQQVDLLLTDAAAGDTTRLKEAEESGIARILRDSLDRGRAAQGDIREILEIARQLSAQSQPSAGGGQSGNEPSQGTPGGQGSPLDGSGKSQTPEATPELPGESPGAKPSEQPGGQQAGQQQQPGAEDPSGEQPGGGEPKSPAGDPHAQGENRSGSEQGGEGGGNQSRASGEDGWGNLPAHVRDTFRSEGRAELPARYRDWIDEYYRKLNQRGPQR